MLMEAPTANVRGAWDSAQAGVLVSVLALWPFRTVAHVAHVFNLALAAPVFTFETENGSDYDPARLNIIFDTQPDHPCCCELHGLVGLSDLGMAQVRYSEQIFQSLLQSATSVDKLFDALEVGGMFTELSLVRAGAAGPGRMAVPHRCGVAAGGRRERRRRETRAEANAEGEAPSLRDGFARRR